jgi:hypothetical protein
MCNISRHNNIIQYINIENMGDREGIYFRYYIIMSAYVAHVCLSYIINLGKSWKKSLFFI